MSTGLVHPRDLPAWLRWQRSTQPLRRRAAASLAPLRRPASAWTLTVAPGSGDPEVVVGLETRARTSVAALLAPLERLSGVRVAVVTPVDVSDLLPGWASRPVSRADLGDLVGDRAVVLSTGHYLPVGAALYAAGPRAFLTVQHGLLTPHAPPLAPGTTLLAWTAADADYWACGRDDVRTQVVGSQLLAEAAAQPADDVPGDAEPVFLGQLHGAELPFELMSASAERFCLGTPATYRPHPGETDRRSIATHARWAAAGVRFDRSTTALTSLGRPVVSAFSTGILEAAASGIPAWVHQDDAPEWLEAFWERCGMRPWGTEATPPPPPAPEPPTLAVARAVHDALEGR